MAVSVMQRCLAVVWGVLTIVLAVTGAECPTDSDGNDAPG